MNKCEQCGDEFYSDGEYEAHRIKHWVEDTVKSNSLNFTNAINGLTMNLQLNTLIQIMNHDDIPLSAALDKLESLMNDYYKIVHEQNKSKSIESIIDKQLDQEVL